MKSVGIIDYGLNNLSSIYYMIKSLDCSPNLIKQNNNQEFDILIIPGVGSFSEGMKNIQKNNFDKLIYKHVEKGKSLIGICLGYQLLFKKSYEINITDGLSILSGNVVPFNSNVISPNIGWNKLEFNSLNKYCFDDLNDVIDNKYFYHVHSYYPEILETDRILSYSNNGKYKFPSSICFQNVYGFQFHPEKSGKNGIILFKNLLKKL